jgi:hypothetical protein
MGFARYDASSASGIRILASSKLGMRYVLAKLMN